MNELEPWKVWTLTAFLVVAILETTAAKVRPIDAGAAVACANAASTPTQSASQPDNSTSNGVEYASYSPGAPHHWYSPRTNVEPTLFNNIYQHQSQGDAPGDLDAADADAFKDEPTDVASNITGDAMAENSASDTIAYSAVRTSAVGDYYLTMPTMPDQDGSLLSVNSSDLLTNDRVEAFYLVDRSRFTIDTFSDFTNLAVIDNGTGNGTGTADVKWPVPEGLDILATAAVAGEVQELGELDATIDEKAAAATALYNEALIEAQRVEVEEETLRQQAANTLARQNYDVVKTRYLGTELRGGVNYW